MSGTVVVGDTFVCNEEDCWIYSRHRDINTADSVRIRVGTIVRVTEVHEEGVTVKTVRNDVHEAEQTGFCHYISLGYFQKCNVQKM